MSDIKKIHLINEITLFSPEEGSLTPRHSWPAGRVTLHTPAADCLQLLIANNGQPVSQKMFFEQVWEKKGAVVSTNTLYQSIASVRKALRATGLEEDVIRTLPKQGFQCNASVRSGELSDFISRPAELSLAEVSAQSVPLSQSAIKNQKGLAVSILLSAVIFAGAIYWQNAQQPAREMSWFSAGTLENCTLYSSWSGAEYSQSVFNELRQRYPIDCAKKTTAYLNVNRLQTGSTLLLCNQAIEQKGTQCQSVMIQDESHENH